MRRDAEAPQMANATAGISLGEGGPMTTRLIAGIPLTLSFYHDSRHMRITDHLHAEARADVDDMMRAEASTAAAISRADRHEHAYFIFCYRPSRYIMISLETINAQRRHYYHFMPPESTLSRAATPPLIARSFILAFMP